MNIRSLDSPYEKVLEEGLKQRKIRYRTQEPIRDHSKYGSGRYRYLTDFVVFGKHCKIVIEVDGSHHRKMKQRARDAVRDLYLITHGYDDVLRFPTWKIRKNLKRCLDEIEEAIHRMDEVYLRREKRQHLDSKTISENPNLKQVKSIVLEVVPLLVRAFRLHPESKKEFLQEFRREMQKRYFGMTYEKLHFDFPYLVAMMQHGRIEFFFSAYNVPFVLILGSHSFEGFESHAKSVAGDRRVIKLFFNAETNSAHIGIWKKFKPVHWVVIDTNGRVKSDLIGSFTVIIPKKTKKVLKQEPIKRKDGESKLTRDQRNKIISSITSFITTCSKKGESLESMDPLEKARQWMKGNGAKYVRWGITEEEAAKYFERLIQRRIRKKTH